MQTLAKLLAVALLGWCSGSAAADPLVEASFVSDAASVDAGDTLRIGVRLRMAEGWHVYWLNPGDSGIATALELELPPGFEVGRVQWPIPDDFESPGGLASYGYGHEVVLWAPVRVTDAPAQEQVAVRADVSWLACRERCVLGDASLEAALPVAAETAARDRAALDAAEASLPRPADAAAPFEIRSVTRLGAAERRGSLVAWVAWRETPAGTVRWFPEAVEGLEVVDVQARTRGELTRIDARVRIMQSDAPTQVQSVLVLEQADGRRTGWRVPVAVRDGSS